MTKGGLIRSQKSRKTIVCETCLNKTRKTTLIIITNIYDDYNPLQITVWYVYFILIIIDE